MKVKYYILFINKTFDNLNKKYIYVYSVKDKFVNNPVI